MRSVYVRPQAKAIAPVACDDYDTFSGPTTMQVFEVVQEREPWLYLADGGYMAFEKDPIGFDTTPKP